MMDAEGEISIPMEEFWQFVEKYNAMKGCEMLYGLPRVSGHHLVVTYAASTDCNPADWVKKPKAALEWESSSKERRDGSK